MTIFINGNEKSEIFYGGTNLDKVYANGTLVHERATNRMVAAYTKISFSTFNYSAGYWSAAGSGVYPAENSFTGSPPNGGTLSYLSTNDYSPSQLEVTIVGGSNASSNFGRMEVTGTFTNGTKTVVFRYQDATSYVYNSTTGTQYWDIPHNGNRFVKGNEYTFKWTA